MHAVISRRQARAEPAHPKMNAMSEDWSTTHPPDDRDGAFSELGPEKAHGILPAMAKPVDTTCQPRAFHLSMPASGRLVLRSR